jgi:drug/metabolite transporter (DMT)-like permease
MDTATVSYKRRKLTIILALCGLIIAGGFFAYSETDPPPQSPIALLAGVAALVLWPGSLLFVTWIDIEAQTTASAVMWLIIGIINFVLYGAVGMVIGRFRWKEDGNFPATPEEPGG